MGKTAEYRCLRYAIVHIDEADSRYGSDDGSPVSSASCKILTTAETETRGRRAEKVCFGERLHERASFDRLIKASLCNLANARVNKSACLMSHEVIDY